MNISMKVLHPAICVYYMLSVVMDGFYGFSLFISIQKGYYHQLKTLQFKAKESPIQEEEVSLDLNEVKNLNGYLIFRQLRGQNFNIIESDHELIKEMENYNVEGLVLRNI